MTTRNHAMAPQLSRTRRALAMLLTTCMLVVVAGPALAVQPVEVGVKMVNGKGIHNWWHKDNRIRPHGYDPEFFLDSTSEYIKVLADTPGEAKFDPYYQDPRLTGADVINYEMDIEQNLRNKVDHVEVTLYSQSIPPFYLQQRFRDANRGPAEKDQIERLHYITSHLNVDDTIDRSGRSVLNDWKFFISKGEKEISN